MSLFPGYGRAWGEPKAEGRIKRFFQIMREPATKRDWLVGLVIVSSLFMLFCVGFPIFLIATAS